MSMHKKPLLPHEEAALVSHGLPVGQPSQLADAFRMGMEAERERCASICFGMVHECSSTGWNACAEMSATEILEQPNTEVDRAGTASA